MPVTKKSLDNLDKGKKFSSNNQPKGRGRKPSALRFVKESGLSVTDVKKIINSLIWDYDASELAALLKDKKNPVPMGMAIVLGALTDDLEKRRAVNFDKFMDRAHGKPVQQIDVSERSGDIPDDPKERRRLMERIEAELGLAQEKVSHAESD